MDPEQVLKDLYNKYKQPLLVQSLYGIPNRWIIYPSQEYSEYKKKYGQPNNRSVFSDEIIFDVDPFKYEPEDKSRMKKEARLTGLVAHNRLKKLNVDHDLYDSGGNGMHGHIVFPELQKWSVFDRKLFREFFIKKLGKGFIYSKEGRAKIQLQETPVIQLEGAKSRKGGTKKIYKSYRGSQEIAHGILLEFYEFKEEMLNKWREEREKNKLVNQKWDKYNIPPKIKYLMEEDFTGVKDGRERALFILATYFKNFMDEQEECDYLGDWNKYVLKGHFHSSKIAYQIRHVKKGIIPNRYVNQLLDELGVEVI